MTSDPLIIETHAPAETEVLGRALARLLTPGTLVALRGDLATGKTCLVRGIASHFGSAASVSSPTFTLINEYGHDPKLYHVDLYRLTSPEEVEGLGYAELFDSDGICVVEWAERAEGLLPAVRLDVALSHCGMDRRRLEFRDLGVMPSRWSQELTAALDGARPATQD